MEKNWAKWKSFSSFDFQGGSELQDRPQVFPESRNEDKAEVRGSRRINGARISALPLALMLPVVPDGNTHRGKFWHPAQVEIAFPGTMEIRAA